ncbi:MAG: ModD protein [Pseudomonadota bacterium]|nr:ModD protein [Pseudomonadota bacterium]
MPPFVPSVFFSHDSIDAWIAEDAPLLDLSTHLLGLNAQPARIQWLARGSGVAACTEEAARVARHCGAQVDSLLPSGTPIDSGSVLLAAHGPADAVLRAWKVAQNLLEYACGVASSTARMVAAVQAAAPGVAVLTTRKHPPGLRAVALKAALAGGALPHRLSVGETVLIFPQHRALLGGWPALADKLAALGHAAVEKHIVIEAASLPEAEQAIAAGAQVVQFDKLPVPELRAACHQLRARHPQVRLLAAGGIREDNATAYAASGVHALVTSSVYHAPPADVGVRVAPLASSSISSPAKETSP